MKYSINNLVGGIAYGVQVRAIVDGQASEWSPVHQITAQTIVSVPPVPTAPVVSAYLAQIKVTWHGDFEDDAERPADFKNVEVHLSTDPDFVTNATTLVATMVDAGTVTITDLPYDTTYYGKLVAVNIFGTKSGDSAPDTATTAQAATDDLKPQTVADLTSDPVFVQFFGVGEGVSGWEQYAGPGELLSAEDTNFEGGTVGNWYAGGSVPPTITNSAVRAYSGTRSMLVTWGAGGSLPNASVTVTRLVPGRQYTASCWVWVPSGSANPFIVVSGITGVFQNQNVKNSWVPLSFTFTATTFAHGIGVWPETTTAAGEQVWVDGFSVQEVGLPGLSWYLDTGAPTVPGVLRLHGTGKCEWRAGSPMAYDVDAVYNMRGRLRVTPPEIAVDGDFALGTGTNWDNFWSSGTVTFDYSGNTGKATATAAASNSTFRNGGTNSNVVAPLTTIRIRGSVRTDDATSSPYVEVVTSTVAGQAQYFGTGSSVAGTISMTPSTTWQDFTVDIQVPASNICYTVYLRNLLANGKYVEWDNISIKELSSTTQIGMIAYKSDKVTPIQPDNVTSTADVIHAGITITGDVLGEDWYEFDMFFSDRSADVSSGDGLTSMTAINLAGQAKYWRPAIVFDAGTTAADDLDIDWFQVDRVKASMSIPGFLQASQVSADTFVTETLTVTGTVQLPWSTAAEGYILTATDDLGSVEWRKAPVKSTVSSTEPTSPQLGDIWYDPTKDFSELVWTVYPGVNTATAASNTTSTWTDVGDTFVVDIPCNGIVLVDWQVWLKVVTAGTLIGFRVVNKGITGGSLTVVDTAGYGICRLVSPTAMGADSTANGKGEFYVTGVDPAVGAQLEFKHQFYNSGTNNTYRQPYTRVVFKPFMNEQMQKITLTGI